MTDGRRRRLMGCGNFLCVRSIHPKLFGNFFCVDGVGRWQLNSPSCDCHRWFLCFPFKWSSGCRLRCRSVCSVVVHCSMTQSIRILRPQTEKMEARQTKGQTIFDLLRSSFFRWSLVLRQRLHNLHAIDYAMEITEANSQSPKTHTHTLSSH